MPCPDVVKVPYVRDIGWDIAGAGASSLTHGEPLLPTARKVTAEAAA